MDDSVLCCCGHTFDEHVCNESYACDVAGCMCSYFEAEEEEATDD